MYFITSSHCKGYDIIHSCWRFFRKAISAICLLHSPTCSFTPASSPADGVLDDRAPLAAHKDRGRRRQTAGVASIQPVARTVATMVAAMGVTDEHHDLTRGDKPLQDLARFQTHDEHRAVEGEGDDVAPL